MSIDSVEESLGVLCFYPARAMEARVTEAAEDAGFVDITPAQNRVFLRVNGDGVRIGELARQALVTKQTATFIVDQLENSGYVERTPDPTDARARLVRLAPRGRALVKVAQAAEQSMESEWAEHLGQDRAAQLRCLLGQLREVTDPTRRPD